MLTGPSPTELRKPRILLIDDDVILLKALSALLRPDYEISVLKDGLSVIARIDPNNPPDAIVMDVEMNGVDGLYVCGHLKSDPETAGIPVVIVSGNLSADYRARAVQAGASGFVGKPVDPDTLRRLLQSVVPRQSSSDAD